MEDLTRLGKKAGKRVFRDQRQQKLGDRGAFVFKWKKALRKYHEQKTCDHRVKKTKA